VTTTTDDTEQPIRIVSIHRGVLTVENAGVRTTHYTIASGREPPKQIYVRHPKLAGYRVKDLPPGTTDQGTAYLVPLPLQAAKTSVLAIEEREPRRRTIELLDAGATQIGLYVEGSKLSPVVAEKLALAIELRKELAAENEARETTRERLGELASRAEEIRESIKSLDKVRGADDLRRKLVASLTQVTVDSDALARELGLKTEALAAARNKLATALHDITLDETP
jgi:hypothetical protein